ncbi:hypothetical protein [aff. Roholtiella sp. LEGE 12411]|uniref:hypothetical protein n=1 Tax=aff. Roholtiella sp. LEGE 12411 TaxID=1828822 RepID=UPI0018815A83|nr:hypothetical protein [aff. Roholtiella sp. LEGE 12411]MBE9035200.1 hypothetical protein [aff. Roholtiella sp. LEGE 12411]
MLLLTVTQILAVDPSTVINNNRAVSDSVRASLKQTWLDAFQSPLYANIAFVGAVFAVLFIGVWTAQFLRRFLGDGDSDGVARGFNELIFPFFLVLLLVNPQVYGPSQGPMLGTLTLGAHNLMIEVSDYILSKLSASTANSNPVTEVGVKVFAQSTAANTISECAKLPEKDARNNCLFSADEKIQKILEPYNNTNWAPPLYQKLQEQIVFAMDNPNDYGNSEWFGRLFGGLGSSLQPVSSQLILSFTMSLGAAFVVLLEIAQLITGLVGPLFLGISLMPVPATPWVTWLVSFFGLSFVDICYKILVGYTAIAILNAGPTDPLIYPLIISILGVVFAVLLAAGGGISLVSAMARTGAQLASRR